MLSPAAQPCVSYHARLRVPLMIFCPLGTILRHRSRSDLISGLHCQLKVSGWDKIVKEYYTRAMTDLRGTQRHNLVNQVVLHRHSNLYRRTDSILILRVLRNDVCQAATCCKQPSVVTWVEQPGEMLVATVSKAKLNLNHVVALSSLERSESGKLWNM